MELVLAETFQVRITNGKQKLLSASESGAFAEAFAMAISVARGVHPVGGGPLAAYLDVFVL